MPPTVKALVKSIVSLCCTLNVKNEKPASVRRYSPPMVPMPSVKVTVSPMPIEAALAEPAKRTPVRTTQQKAAHRFLIRTEDYGCKQMAALAFCISAEIVE